MVPYPPRSPCPQLRRRRPRQPRHGRGFPPLISGLFCTVMLSEDVSPSRSTFCFPLCTSVSSVVNSLPKAKRPRIPGAAFRCPEARSPNPVLLPDPARYHLVSAVVKQQAAHHDLLSIGDRQAIFHLRTR